VVSKAELPGSAELAGQLTQELGRPVQCISAVTGKGLPQLVGAIAAALTTLKEAALSS